MSVQLLDKTRKINKLLHNSSSSKVVFNDICQVLMETLSSNILVLSKKGKVLGISLCPGVKEITELIEDNVGGHVDELLNERFLGVLSTKENVNLQTLGFEHVDSSCQGIINPIDIAGERLGTVFMYRDNKPYDIEDIIVSEYGTTVVGLEMMRAVHEENAEEDRKQQVVKSAFNTLSFSELEDIPLQYMPYRSLQNNYKCQRFPACHPFSEADLLPGQTSAYIHSNIFSHQGLHPPVLSWYCVAPAIPI